MFPEHGVLHLSEPLAPGKHLMLTVIVQEGPNSYTGWGWAVDTAETLNGPPRRADQGARPGR